MGSLFLGVVIYWSEISFGDFLYYLSSLLLLS